MQLQNALAKVSKCFVAPDTIDPKLLKDQFAFLVAITVINNAIKSGQITDEQAEKVIKGESVDIVYN